MVRGRRDDAHDAGVSRGTSRRLALSPVYAVARRHGFVIVGAALLGLVVVGTDAGSLTVDTKPALYLDPWGALRDALSAWQEVPALGQSSFQVGLAPVAFTVGVLQALGLPPWLSVRVLRWVLLVVGSLGTGALARDILRAVPSDRRESPWGPRAAAVVFALHPYLLVAGATLPVLWPAALLPWQLWCVHRAMRSGRPVLWGLWFALSTAAMTGQNAGAVVALQSVAVPVVLVWAALVHRRRLREVLSFLLVGGSATLLLSAYWLLPTLGAVGAGASVVEQSESPEAIAATSSFAEVLRGLGLWPLYGRGATGPWQGEHSLLITSPPVILAGFALPLLAWVLARRARRAVLVLPVLLIGVAAVVMVGAHPWAEPSAVGTAWERALDSLPALGALRTTNKAGAALAVGVALLAGVAVAAGAQRHGRRFALVGVVALASVLPGWTGGLFISSVNVPSYWSRAAADAGTGSGRLWLLPGQSSAHYRWSDARPDDVGQTLVDRASLVRTTVGNTSAQGSNLLAAVDGQLQEGTLPPQGLAVVSRYLGVGSLLVRNDVVWEASGGASPRRLMAQVQGATGVRSRSEHGAPGATTEGQPPLALFDVDDPTTAAGLADPAQEVIVSGDGAAVGILAQLGYLDGRLPFRYTSDTTAEELVEVARVGGRLVLTDTNRREPRIAGRLTEDHGRLRADDEQLGSSAALGTVADQSVLVRHGWGARASNEGSVFRELSWSRAENAVDGDPRTAWYAGDFGSAAGQHLDVDLGRPVTDGRLVVRTVGSVTGVSVDLGSSTVQMTRSEPGVFVGTVTGPPLDVDTLRVTLTGVDEGDDGGAGVAELEVPGPPNPDAAAVRTPRGVADLTALADADDRAALSRMPTDVVLRRVTGGPGAPPTETQLRRDVVLPAANRVSFRGAFTLDATMPERVLDEIDGSRSEIEATSSSRAFDLPTVRASMALDGDLGTGWSPAEPAVGASWRVRMAEPVQTDEILVRQPTGGRQVTSVDVVVNGEVVTRATVGPGLTRIGLGDDLRIQSLELRLAEVSAPASESVRLLEVELGSVRLERSATPACFTAATLDGTPVKMRPTAPITRQSFLAVDCDPDLSTPVTEGTHAWRPVPGFVADTVTWADADTPAPGAGSTKDWQDVALVEDGLSRWTGEVSAASLTRTFVSGMGYDPRWRLEVDGRDLGAPKVTNGYAAAWEVPPGLAGPVVLHYGLQSTVTAGFAVTTFALLGVLVLLWLLRPRSRAVQGGPVGPAAQLAPATPVTPVARGTRAQARARARAQARALGRRPWPRSVVPLLVVAAGWAVGGWLGLLVALAAVAVGLWSHEGTWWLGVACWGALPIAWLLQATGVLGEVTPDLVTRTTAAHVVGMAAVIVSVVHVSLWGEPRART